MARSLRWKATVALNFLFCISFVSAYAQSSSVKSNISYSCRGERLESVIEHLSKATGYDFIYSRDLVDMSQPVSLAVKNKSINEVLSLIGKQVHVSFKLKEHHIIVKSAPKAMLASRAISPTPVFKSTDSLLITSISKTIPVMPFESHQALLQNHLEKRIREVQDLLGPGVPRNIPPYYISQINFNNRNKSWFAAVGTFVSDNESGIEIQAGLPYLYAVFHPHYTFGQGFYGVYGLGNSINLVGNFSFNTIYMYSSRTRSEVSDLVTGPYVVNSPSVVRRENARQHQVKMMVQYAFSKNLVVRAGPVLNYLTTLREVTITAFTSTPEAYPVYGPSSYTYRNTQLVTGMRSQLVESWIGWEASIQYRINFFNRK